MSRFPAVCLLPAVFARVAQLTERWSYKPEVEGLNPSLGTSTRGRSRWQQQAGLHTSAASCLAISGRDSSRQNGYCLGPWSSKRRVGLTPRPIQAQEHKARAGSPASCCCLLFLSLGPRSRHRSSKPNLRRAGRKGTRFNSSAGFQTSVSSFRF